MMLELTALPSPFLLPATLARRAAEYARIEAGRTETNWSATDEAQAAIVMEVAPGQRRAFHAMVNNHRRSQ